MHNLPSFSLTSAASNYTWRQLAQRAGVSFLSGAETGFEPLGAAVYYGDPGQAQLPSPGLIISRCAGAAWETLLSAPENSLRWIPAGETVPPGARLPFNDPVPVLFWGVGLEEGDRPFAERAKNGSVVFNVDILAASFFMLSRWEEMTSSIRDAHDRFPATTSVAYKQRFLDRPVVDEYALILREWIKVLRPGWKPKKRSFSVKLSHDIDHIRRLPTTKSTLRALVGDLVKRRNIKLAINTIKGGLGPQSDPYYVGIKNLANISLNCGIASDAFYFKTTKPGKLDSGYDLEEPLMRNIIYFLQKNGFEIGIHPGYDTYNNLPLLKKEKEQLDRILGYSGYGGRQHYLRFKIPDTWRHWEAAGLEYDSTLGYADYEGFRCGTCHPYRPFDIEQNRELDLIEVPLVVMDGTLAEHRKLSPEQGYQVIMELAHRCKEVAGVFTLLWHNSSFYGKYYPWARIYKKVVAELSRL